MSYVEYLQKTIDYIEENIKQPITIEVCADVAGFSKYHFYRLFTLFVGVRGCYNIYDKMGGK
ncbi:MAG: hypothetical protein ACREV6_04760 [Clostridium sp.]|uniref:hypothetical protein n=1 Tax=Clostridium sp. TaxID=1506 RepID=UPI003D6CA924